MNEKTDLQRISVTQLHGIGDKKASALAGAGVSTVNELLRYFPRAYQNRKDTRTLLEAEIEGTLSSVVVTVASNAQSVMLKNRKYITKFTVFDSSGKCTVIFFNKPYLKNSVFKGETYRLWGKVTRNRGASEMISPEMELVNPSLELHGILPVYPLTKALSQKGMRALISGALAEFGESVQDTLPRDISEKYSLMSTEDALRAIHFPRSFASLQRARDYFVFEEFFTLALCVALSKKENTRRTAPSLPTSKSDFKKFLSSIPYEPTGAQKRVINEIASDMSKGSAMHRLVAGDVGCGKTLCAAAAAYICVSNGYQCTLMAPTEILARQHYAELAPLFESLGYTCALLVGSLSAKEKLKVQKELESGTASFVIGTHALISGKVRLARPGLAICDEQHRFGISQRAELGEKAGDTHMLVMSATPIPRTLALVMYGDLDVSFVDEMPPGRQKVSTFLVDESYRERLDAFIEKQVNDGHRVYIVCPTIEQSDDEDEMEALVDTEGRPISPLKDAVGYTKALSERMPGINIGYVHGRMKGKEKDAVMRAFERGDISVLVSTTVIEVGVNVPAATLMIVENAERFGLSQLHQLRGRVGRGSAKSYCILVSDSESKDSLARLRVLCENTDGYKIAEKDLEIRGPGDFLASTAPTRQHGSAGFKVASLSGDLDIMTKAFSAADECVQRGDINEQMKSIIDSALLSFGQTLS